MMNNQYNQKGLPFIDMPSTPKPFPIPHILFSPVSLGFPIPQKTSFLQNPPPKNDQTLRLSFYRHQFQSS